VSRADGALSADEVRACPGWPGEDCLDSGKVAVLECVEDIPCNPCEVICPAGAITVGSPITSLPAIDGAKCTGCGLCIAACPGLAIFVVEKNHDSGRAAVSLPYELLPLPRQGQAVRALDRSGSVLCPATVLRVQQAKRFDRTNVITIAVERKYYNEARGIEVLGNG
jgi:Fe-S-cluster-containing hydrogenase component 2